MRHREGRWIPSNLPTRLAPALTGGLLLSLAFCPGPFRAADAPKLSNGAARSPREEQATFRVPKGFRVELVACEPDVVDPVAMAFDEDGRLFVAEMRGYPNGGRGTGTITSGRIKLLEDRDGDGLYETSRVYADGLRFPMGLLPWRGGLLVAVAPDLLLLEPAGDGRTVRKRTLYTGFNLDNIQQMVNSPRYGLDNWVHACAGSNGGTARSAERPDRPGVPLRARGFRFRPDVPASLEPTSGGGQYGIVQDDSGRWLTATNSQHLRHIVLPDHYLRRNPALPVRAVTLDIPDHGAACKVFRLSPFEAWRVERTTRRAGDKSLARRLPSTELVPGGFITSACSPLIYAADVFPPAYRGNVFVCDPANNLIHRDILTPRGGTYTAARGDADCEFLASTDNWFRPVHLTLGPDGAMYVLDFYREAIETPLSLPEDIQKRLNLQSRGRGRIWRITVADAPRRPRPALGRASTAELVKHLADANRWWRITAQRLLVDRQDRAAVPPLTDLLRTSKSAAGRIHALWTLHGLKALTEDHLAHALKDADADVREQAVRLCDERLAGSARLREAVTALADDASPRVRFQLAFTLGEADTPETVRALARIARRDAADPWTQTALLSSAGRCGPALLEALVGDAAFVRQPSAGRLQMLTRLAALVGAKGEADRARSLALLAGKAPESVQLAILDGLGQGMRDSGLSLARLWDRPPPALAGAVRQAHVLFERAATTARDARRPLPERLAAVGLLRAGPFPLLAGAAPDLLRPQAPPELQLAAVRALSVHDDAGVPALLLGPWDGYSPTVRREVIEALFARPARLAALLEALEKHTMLPNQLEPLRIAQLRSHRDARVRQRAAALLKGLGADRAKILATYRPALELPADRGRGKMVFAKNCATCHRLDNQGVEVGPDLVAALRNKSPEQLLIDVLDPSREADPRYLTYVVTTRRGQVFSGMIAAETASSLTLRRGEKAEDTVLRAQVESIQATAKSLMPEGLEMQLSKQDLADLIAYLRAAAVPK